MGMLIATETRLQEINGIIPIRNRLVAFIGRGETRGGLNPFRRKSIVRKREQSPHESGLVAAEVATIPEFVGLEAQSADFHGGK